MACIEEGEGVPRPIVHEMSYVLSRVPQSCKSHVDVDEFEEAWDLLLDKYWLRAHGYMTHLYKIREKWAKPYFKGFFVQKCQAHKEVRVQTVHEIAV